MANSREEILTLFLRAFDAWGPERDPDRAIDLADQAIRAAVAMGDDDIARRVIRGAAFLQGMAAPQAAPGPIRRTND